MIRKSISEKLTNKDGAALVTVLVIFLTLVVIITSATYAALGNFKRTVSASNKSSAIYVAEAGLYEVDEIMVDYFLINKENIDYDVGFVEEFKDYLLSQGIDSDPIKKNYGKIMNQDAHSEVIIDYTAEQPDDPDITSFEIKSTGFIGEESRTVKKGFSINVVTLVIEGEGGLQPGGISLVDPEESISDFIFPTGSSNEFALDSFVTNKRIILNNTNIGAMGGPLVTNNEIITTTQWINIKWGKSVIITSDVINFDKDTNEFSSKAVMFKPKKNVVGGNQEDGYEFEYDYDNSYINVSGSAGKLYNKNVKYIFIPEGADVNKYFRVNHEVSSILKTDFETNGTKIIRYKPHNLNPYEDEFSPELAPGEILDIFGEDPENFEHDDEDRPKIDYRDYFKSDFILDNMHDENIVQKNRPKVKLPDINLYSKYYDDGHQVKKTVQHTTLNNSSHVVIRNDVMNLTTGNSNNPLNLAEVADKYGSDVLPFDSITLGHGWYNDPSVIDVGNKKITLITKSLELKHSFELLAEEEGSLEIVVVGQNMGELIKDDFKTSTFRHFNAPTSSQLRLVVYESLDKDVLLNVGDGDPTNKFNATVFSENLNLLTSATYTGNFISAKGETVEMLNTSASVESQLIYAPNAKLTLNGGTLKGVVVVSSYDENNKDTSFIFDPSTSQNLIDEIGYPIFDYGESAEGGIEIDGNLDFNDVIQEVDE